MKLSTQSEAVAKAIFNEQEENGGIGASLQDIHIDTNLPKNVIKGHLSDLFNKGIIMVLRKEDSGYLPHDLYTHNDWSE